MKKKRTVYGLWYRICYAWRFVSRGGMTWREAWAYPLPWADCTTGSPFDDADTEMYYWDGD